MSRLQRPYSLARVARWVKGRTYSTPCPSGACFSGSEGHTWLVCLELVQQFDHERPADSEQGWMLVPRLHLAMTLREYACHLDANEKQALYASAAARLQADFDRAFDRERCRW